MRSAGGYLVLGPPLFSTVTHVSVDAVGIYCAVQFGGIKGQHESVWCPIGLQLFQSRYVFNQTRQW